MFVFKLLRAFISIESHVINESISSFLYNTNLKAVSY